jgi:hypothetical protein
MPVSGSDHAAPARSRFRACPRLIAARRFCF